jgi:tetrapyrrole methylase family protein/MazG family protein
MRVTVVGLGPGPAEWISAAGVARLRTPGLRVFARTRLHPALTTVLDGLAWASLDDVYEQAASLAEVESAIVSRLVASGSDVVLAVPGDGVLGESVLAALRLAGATVEVVPGVALAVGALLAAGVAAGDGAQVVEATALGGSGIALSIELNPRWPAVVTGVFSRQVASDLKLTLERVYPPEHVLSVVRHPGLHDQRIVEMALAELDRATLDFDHLTHVVIPSVALEVPTGSAHGVRAIIARLRAPEIGCPWDLEQTHRSLTPFVIEEAYEVVDAIEDGDPASLADELGDVLLQVVLHAEVADQADEFEWNDVVRALSAKLIRRHPHVFGEVQVGGASDVVRNWAVLKARERDEPPTSALDGVPRSLPALKRAAALGRKAVKAGFDWPTREGTVDKVREELAELLEARTLDEQREELGDVLWILAKLAWQDGVDPEDALHAANHKFSLRFRKLEELAQQRGWQQLSDAPRDDLLALWTEVKAQLKASGGSEDRLSTLSDALGE